MSESRKQLQNVDPMMLLCAFRYALGRMTYIVSQCREWLEMYWDCLPTAWQTDIHHSIRHAIDHNIAGHDCDVAEWRKVLQLEVRSNRDE